jgi:hypothetical protein
MRVSPDRGRQVLGQDVRCLRVSEMALTGQADLPCLGQGLGDGGERRAVGRRPLR